MWLLETHGLLNMVPTSKSFNRILYCVRKNKYCTELATITPSMANK